MGSSSTLPPSLKLKHLWPTQDRLEYLKRRGLKLHQVEQAKTAKTEEAQAEERNRCAESVEYFIENYIRIYDATEKQWIRFHLWPEQVDALMTIHNSQLIVILKARQIGLTWLVLAYVLWLMLFNPFTTALLFSLRDTEAVYLLSDERLRGMFERLPSWMRAGIERDDGHYWKLSNGSSAKAFPTSAGDSYTASIAVVDEADLVPDLNKLMRRVKPTIDAGGKMILLSRSNKSLPNSEFKRIYRGAKQKLTKWISIFLPWYVRPDRDERWYKEQKTDILHRTGALDDLHEQYPATDTEALAPRSLDKRIPGLWLERCYRESESLELEALKKAPSIPGLIIFKEPEPGRKYVIGLDPAEGNPTSDDSSIEILDRDSGEEVATLTGKFQPSTISAHADLIGQYFNDADVMIERNNHGHACILWFQDNSDLKVLDGLDDRPGWLDNSRGKTLLYDTAADAFKSQDTIVHNFATFTQLASIEGSTLRAPEGEMDDLADAYALALVARSKKPAQYRKPVVAGKRTAVQNFRKGILG